jgi:phage baseplate assembly protein gpV
MIARHVWRFSDGSSVEFETATKQITHTGGGRGLAFDAMLRIRDTMPDMMRAALGQKELDGLIISGLDLLIK